MNPINRIAKLFVFIILAAIVLIAVSSPVSAAKGKKNRSQPEPAKLWRQVDESSVPLRGGRSTVPEKYLVFRLNQPSLKSSLAELPLENTAAAREKNVVMEIPMPDGTIQRFRMEETQVLAPHLAAEFPDWKTFIGYGIDDLQAIGRFDWNALGFHGYIETGKGTIYVDPYQQNDKANYLVFYKHEFGKSTADFYCRTENQVKQVIEMDPTFDLASSAPAFSFGANLRVFKLAIAATGEWTRNAGNYPTVTDPVQLRTNALAVITTAVTRLNGIFERELASRFQLTNPGVSDNATNIIFDDPAADPFSNTDSDAELTANQNTITARVGTANFDIGHLFGTGGGGYASTPSLCSNASKAEGYSARGTNTGDPFVVDYVAHEIGHQFGSNHTYNNIDPNGAGSCPASSYSAANAYEVGSGSTIMSYVGICGSRNLQQYVDPVFPSFHIRSLTVIDTTLNTGDRVGCGTTSGTNNPPTVTVGNAFTIPRLTPFTLTATGGDPDAGDVANLLYSWEEYDLAQAPSGVAGNPAGTYDVDTDGVLRPLFRAYSPVTSNSRTFPSLTFIRNPANNDATADVNGVRGNQPVLTYMGTHPTGFPGAVCETGQTCVIGERLPTVSRAMTFRVSLRDRRGGVVDAPTTVTIAGGAGPFQITTQNTLTAVAPTVTWQAGTQQTVTWDVAATNDAPVNALNVNILLSTDGGLTFPVTLAANTLNDGSQPITVPNNQTTTARIKVEAVGNIFFDINNANFAITAPPTSASVSVSGRVLSTFGRGVSNARVILTDQHGVARTARTNSFGYYRFVEVEAGQTYIFTVSHKRYRFLPRVVSVVEDLSEFDFIATN